MNPEYTTPEIMQTINNVIPYVATFAAGWMGNNLWYNTKKERKRLYGSFKDSLENILRR